MKLSPAKQLTLVVLVALALRLGVAWWWHERIGGGFVFGDSGGYWALGQAIARGGPYQYGPETQIFRTPGYPILLAPIFLVAGPDASVYWGRALSGILGAASIIGVWWLGKRLFGPTAGMAAAVVAAVYPGAIATGVLVLTEAPFGLLMLVHLILWTIAWQAQGTSRSAAIGLAAGLAAGAATLVRPSWLLFTPMAVAVGLVFGRQRARHAAIGLAMLSGLAVMMAPWAIRNRQVCGHFVPTTLQVGASLYDGLNPTATGASDMRFVPPMTEAERSEPGGGGRFADPSETFEYRLDRRMRQEAVDWARQHPARAAHLALIKLVRIWNIWPNEPSLSNWIIRAAVAVTYLPVAILALIGAWRTIGRGWPYVLCWLPAVYFTLLHMIFVGSIRYRQPAMLTLMVLAAGTVFGGRQKETERSSNDEHVDDPARRSRQA